jgi:8-oxo-dGTP pyrophosphatase MutT (NUDIX family)
MLASMPEPRSPRLSATVLLVRDGPRGLEVFMVERHHQIDFATGALVFPGGQVDAADADEALADRCTGGAALGHEARVLRVAAIRETFEESGVLLARRRGSAALVDAGTLRGIEARHRAALHAGQRTLAEIAAAEDLELACDLLVPFAHWITPVFMPKRFDTWFFLVAAPADQAALHDGHESVDSAWLTPAEAEAARSARRRTIIFPTLLNVRKLGRAKTVADAIANARSQPIVTVLPRVEQRGGTPTMVLPADAGYDVVEAPLAEVS